MQTASDKNQWPLILQGIVVLLMVTAGVWALISAPLSKDFAAIDRRLDRIEALAGDAKQAVAVETARVNKLFDERRAEFVTGVEFHAEARRLDVLIATLAKVDDQRTHELNGIKNEIEKRRLEVASKSDVQQGLNTTRVEFLAEIKRLDQLIALMQSASKAEATGHNEKDDIIINSLQKRIEALELNSLRK